MTQHKNKSSACPKVLVVDDDRRLLGAMCKRLNENGCSCVACDNASEAMLQFAAGGFDAVVTDLTMAGVDGMGIVGLIRSQSNVPIIVVSGHANEYESLLGSYEHVTVLRKPFEPSTFVDCVKDAVTNSGREYVRSA